MNQFINRVPHYGRTSYVYFIAYMVVSDESVSAYGRHEVSLSRKISGIDDIYEIEAYMVSLISGVNNPHVVIQSYQLMRTEK